MSEKRQPTLEIYEIRSGGAWNWRLKGANGEKMARGSEPKGFSSPQAVWRNITKVRKYLGIEEFPARLPKKGSTVAVEGLKVVRCG